MSSCRQKTLQTFLKFQKNHRKGKVGGVPDGELPGYSGTTRCLVNKTPLGFTIHHHHHQHWLIEVGEPNPGCSFPSGSVDSDEEKKSHHALLSWIQELWDILKFKVFHATSSTRFSTRVTAFVQAFTALDGGKIILPFWEPSESCKHMPAIVIILMPRRVLLWNKNL